MKFALTQGAYQARSLIAEAQTCLNLYGEPNPPDSPFPFTYYPTPGLSFLTQDTLNQNTVRCLYRASNGACYAAIGGKIYSVSDGYVLTSLGTITNGTTPVCMADNGLAVLIVDGTPNGYCIDLATNTFGVVNDSAFYGADKVDYLDTYFILNRPGTSQFYISLSNVTFANLTGTISPDTLYAAFDPLDIASKTSYPDPISTLIVMHREIWLLGELTSEVWFNSGATDFTFQSMPGVFLDHGCVATHSVARQDLATYWLGQDRQGQKMVFAGMGYQAKRVSTFAIENEIASYSTVSDAIGFTYQELGHVFYVLIFPTANKTWVYDIATGQWHERAWADNNGNLNRIRANCTTYFNGLNIVGDWEDGSIYHYDPDNFTDYGVPIIRKRSFPHFQNEDKRVIYSQFLADMEVGPSGQQLLSVTLDSGGSGYTSPPAITLSGGGGTGAAAEAVIALAVSSVSVTNGGTGYTSAPSVAFIGGGGWGATGTASIAQAISSLSVTNSGSGYTSAPSVSFSGGGGTGAAATANLLNSVSAISVTAAGSGYSSAPTVSITGGGGTGATATASLINGTVTGLSLTSAGSGYTSAPSVSISGGGGSGATATATVGTGGIASITITAGGLYLAAPTVSFSGGGGSGAAGTALVTGSVYSATVTNGGRAYEEAPTVTIHGGGGSGATGIANFHVTDPTLGTGVVNGVTITNGGSGYTSAPTISFSGGGGFGAKATATIGYTVSGINVTNPGSGYTSAPSISFSGLGSGAAATATVNTGIQSFTVTNAGSGYTSAPTVSISGGGGTGATATATISAQVGSISVTNGGSGYTSVPTVSLSGGGGTGSTASASIIGIVQGLTLTNPGSGYTGAPSVSISGGGGTGATATATVDSTVVSVTVTNGGQQYTSAPSVQFSGGGGTGTTATAIISGPITGINVTKPGFDYTSAPTISFSGGGGTGATATAVIGQTSPLISLRWSDTRGKSWGNAVMQSFGYEGQFLTSVQWQRLGMARDRVFELSWSAPYKVALNGAYVSMRASAS